MTQHQIDSNSLRAELRGLPRGSLLLIAERALELVPRDQLNAMLCDIVHINAALTDAGSIHARPNDASTAIAPSLLDEVRLFHHAAMNGDFYEHLEISNRRRREQSGGTDAFIAEFDRLMRKCVGASARGTEPAPRDGPGHGLRDCFELLFALLRRIDEGHDDVLFFANDGSSLDVGVNWRVVLPAYFECLAEAEASSPEEFARAVDEVIAEFAVHDRTRLMGAARAVANDAQRAALASKLVMALA